MILPSLESLRCFEAAAQLGSFRAAGKAVALTPAAVGQRIKLLEEQLGAELFARTTRSCHLTEAGLALLPRAREALLAAEACGRAVRGEDVAAPFELVLGTRSELGLSFLLPLRGELEAATPGLQLQLYFGSGPDLLLRLRGREVDCAVTSSRLDDPVLSAIALHQEDYALVGARTLLKRSPIRKREDTARHVLLDIDSGVPLYRYWRDAPGAEGGLTFQRLCRLGTTAAIRQVALEGGGLAVLPRYMIEGDLQAKRLGVVLPSVVPLHDHFRLVFRGDHPRKALFAQVARLLLQHPLR